MSTKNLTFYVTTNVKNVNGKVLNTCIVKGVQIDCDLISKCQQGNCDELEKYLITNKIVEIANTQQQNKSVNQDSKSGYYISANTDKKEICVGEQIYVEYIFYIKQSEIARDFFGRLVPPETGQAKTNFNGFWVKDKLSKDDWEIEGDYIKKTIYRGTLTAQKSGKLTLDPALLEFIYKMQEKREIKSKPITITVADLPSPPADFKGAVGNMTIESEVDNTTINANDAITYKLTITGTGNIELIQALNIQFPEDFEVYDPKISDRIFEGGLKRSIKTFEYLLIPRYKGKYTIPSATLIVYNPVSKAYETKKSSQHQLIINPSTNNENENTSTNQQIVKNEQKDINYIATKTDLSTIGKNTIAQNLFYLLFFLPIGFLIFFKIYDTIVGKTNTNSTEWKNRKANKIAQKRLKNAQKCINNADFDGFFEEIEKSLWGYFADKFKVNSAELSKETVTNYFVSSEINKQIEEKFIALLNECEFARYAPASNKNAQMDTILEKAKTIIIEVETALK
ncbi:MAG: BatD family protein [Bacteroidetes bacterium]|nr:BatD family protein [Bacteroidota bacterium]